MNYFNVVKNPSGVCDLIFDTPDSDVNVLKTSALLELKSILEELNEDDGIKLLVFKSAKESIFIAGADISEIEKLYDMQETIDLISQGQHILGSITKLPFPTLALIDGACLGGGLELALACSFRLVTDSSKAVLGLPEVNLGILPGFGGTQRLPKLIGLQSSLDMILTGKMIKGDKAQKIGLVDWNIPKAYLPFRIEDIYEQIINKPKEITAKRTDAFLEKVAKNISPLRDYIFSKAKEKVLKKSKGFYPAPIAVIDVIKSTFDMEIEHGLEIEREEFAKLAVGEISKNLVHLFFVNENVKKIGKEYTDKPQVTKNTSVIGSGTMGNGIVWGLTNAEYGVRLKLRRWEQTGAVFKKVYSIYSGFIKRRKLSPREVELKMDHITYSTDFKGFSRIDFAIEAIAEKMDVKKALINELEEVMKPEAIIATNTSSLSINELSSDMKNKDRFIGIHFFNPVDRMPLVEIIPSANTSDRTIVTALEIVRKLGKTPIIVGDCAGFLVNRVLLPYLNESVKMFEEGGDIEIIDKTMEEFGLPMGPFTLADTVGIDIGYHVANVLEDAYGERMKVAEIFSKIYDDEKLRGVKSSQGFYSYGSEEKEVNNRVLKLREPLTNEFEKEIIIDRAVLTMINEASRCLEEEIVKSAEHLDMAMIMGSGFPPFRGGLLKYADSLGIDEVVERLTNLQNSFGERFCPSDYLLKMKEENGAFYTK